MLISEVARRSDVPAKTLRYYEEIGLLRPERTPSGYREYDERVFDRLAFIRSAQALGLSLAEIRGIVTLRDNGEAPCAHVTQLLEERSQTGERTLAFQRQLTDLVLAADGLEGITDVMTANSTP